MTSKSTPLTLAIIEAIRSAKAPKGSSSQKIVNIIGSKFTPLAIKKAIKAAVAKELLIQTGQSYKVAGDPEYADTTEKVAIEEVRLGTGRPVVAGDTVTIAYTGRCLQSDGVMGQFDAAKAFSFQVGADT